MWKR
jgi:hypothetical protein